ncbi:hypothetical protein V6N12_046578 [Hibiscus sabdariffa]|uniref:Uncharacterized protein n=1 Tax=Hibiscus sabdariffa TaxID=183260 RepID=A0ABR2DK06_9ROSI
MSNKVRFLLSETPFHCGVPSGVICRELNDLGRTQRQQNLKERSCTEAAPNEETQNGAEKTSAEKRTSAEILGRGRKGNSIRPAIQSPCTKSLLGVQVSAERSSVPTKSLLFKLLKVVINVVL